MMTVFSHLAHVGKLKKAKQEILKFPKNKALTLPHPSPKTNMSPGN